MKIKLKYCTNEGLYIYNYKNKIIFLLKFRFIFQYEIFKINI